MRSVERQTIQAEGSGECGEHEHNEHNVDSEHQFVDRHVRLVLRALRQAMLLPRPLPQVHGQQRQWAV